MVDCGKAAEASEQGNEVENEGGALDNGFLEMGKGFNFASLFQRME